MAKPIKQIADRDRMLELAIKSMTPDQEPTTEKIVKRAKAFAAFVSNKRRN